MTAEAGGREPAGRRRLRGFGYHLIAAKEPSDRPEVLAFLEWLETEAAASAQQADGH